jgi:hypothetical protein
MASNMFGDQALRETAQTLTPEQRQLLGNLSDRGPGLLLELAVRQLSFPEQISAPLNDLRERGLVRAEPFGGGQLGGELYYLTTDGRQVVGLLREDAARGESGSSMTARSAPAQAQPRDPRLQQAELLQKLGDLAAQSGQVADAQQYYKQALELTRTLAETSARYTTDTTDQGRR